MTFKKLLIALICIVLPLGQVAAQLSEKELAEWKARGEANRKWLKEHYTKTESMIEMRDGIHLFTAIYAPKDNSQKHPIIMTRTPYSCEAYGDDWKNFSGKCWKPYLDAGYIIVLQDVRGRNYSEGTYEDIRPFYENKNGKPGKKQIEKDKQGHILIDEASDTYDTADWLVKHTHNNGCIGVMGISYPGFYSTMAGLSGHPAIKAVSPQAPVTDWFRGDDAHHNGALFQEMFSFEYWFQYRNCKNPSTGINPCHFPLSGSYEGMLALGCPDSITHLLGDSVDMWNNVIQHPHLDNYWNDRDVSLHCHDMQPAVMVVGGLFDAEDCYGAWRTYRAIRSQSPKTELYLVEGPWSHGAWSSGADVYFGDIYFGPENTSDYYSTHIEYPFFAYYLEGKGSKPASVRIFQTGENRWRTDITPIDLHPWGGDTKLYSTVKTGSKTEQEALGCYYVPNVTEENSHSFYLADNKVIGESDSNPLMYEIRNQKTPGISYISDPQHPVPFTATPTSETPRTYMVEDQRFASRRPDVATFRGNVLNDTIRSNGPVIADLDVAISTSDADFIVKVIDEFPDTFEYPDSINVEHETASFTNDYSMTGYQMLVRGEVMRGKYRHSLANPEPFEPGKPTHVQIIMPDIAHTWLPGHRLVVQVQSTWFPLVDRNPQQFCNIYTCQKSDYIPTTVTILPTSKIILMKKGN